MFQAFIYLESLPDILAARLRQTYYFDPELTEEQKEEVIMRKLAKFTWDVNMLMRVYPKKARRVSRKIKSLPLILELLCSG